MSIAKINLALFSVLALTLATGCESKFSESSPDAVVGQGKSLDDRIEQKAKIDVRLDQIEHSAEKINKILEMFKKIQAPNVNANVYTPLDFLIDANKTLRSKLPENHGESLVRRANLELPIESLSEECRNVQTMLETSTIYDDADETKKIGEKVSYSLMTCKSNDQYATIIEAQWINNELDLKFYNKALERIVAVPTVNDLLKKSACQVKQDQNKIIETITCQNFDIKISVSEKANISSMVFSNKGDVRFEAQADILENETVKSKSHIQVLANGEVKFDNTKVENSKLSDAK